MTDEPLSEPEAAGNFTVVEESSLQRDGFWGLLFVLCSAALVRGYAGAQTTAGRIVVSTIVGAVVVLIFVGWLAMRRRKDRLHVSAEEIKLVGKSREAGGALSRTFGDELHLVAQGSARYRYLGLTLRGSEVVLPLRYFSRAKVKGACLAYGWRFVASGRPLRDRDC